MVGADIGLALVDLQRMWIS